MRRERRKFFRLQAYQLIKYRVVSLGEKRDFPLGAVKDISGGGVCFRIEEDLPISSILELYINVPFLDQPLPTLAKVIWKRKMGRSNKYEMGAQFLEIKEAHQKKIIEHIDFVKAKTKVSRWKNFLRR